MKRKPNTTITSAKKLTSARERKLLLQLIARFQRLQEQLYLSHELLERNLLVSQQVARENQLGRQSWKSVNPWTIAGKRLKATAAILIFRSNESLRYKTASTAHAGSSPL